MTDLPIRQSDYTNPCFIYGTIKAVPNGILFPVFVGK